MRLPVSTNVADYAKKDLQAAFTNATVTTSVLLELIAYRKTVLGAHHADHEKFGMTEDQLALAHAVLDANRLTMVNRTVVRLLHDAVYPSNTVESPDTIKLRSILKTPEVTKILQGEKLLTESQWAVHPWLMPPVHMYGRLTYKFEGMTDMINGSFMEDLSELLNSATGDQRRRKSFYEIDTEFEKMTASLQKNFTSMQSLMPFLRASLRQSMMRRLALVGKDKDGWKRADEHLTTLMDQEHMITIEDTDAAIKRCEQYLQRAATDEGSPKPRFLRLRWRSRDKIPQLNLLHSRRLPRLRKPRSRRSRRSCAETHRVPSVHAAEPQWTRNLSQCALCVANGGTMPQTVGTSWTPTKLNSMWPRRTVTRRRRTWPSASRLAKNQRLTPPLLLLIKPWRPLRPPRIPTTPRVMRLYTAACLIKSSCLIRPALYLIAARNEGP